MNDPTTSTMTKLIRLGLTLLGGVLVLVVALLALRSPTAIVRAQGGDLSGSAIIPPAEGGYPKLTLSTKTVSPTLLGVGGGTLSYIIELKNTGSYTAEGVNLTDIIPANTTYNNDGQATNGAVSFNNNTLTWNGIVGFDDTTVIEFSVNVDPVFSGTILNEATVNAPLIKAPLTLQAEAAVTDEPLFIIGKTSAPDKPGPGKPLTYTLMVTNVGQAASGLALTVTDQIPADTAFSSVGPDGSLNGNTVTWNRSVDLAFGQATTFTFGVDVDNVAPGAIISNDTYQVEWANGQAGGAVHTATVVLPDLKIFKETWPDPPGSNREMTYTLTVINRGSLATDLVVTDHVPNGVAYVSGGSEAGGIVTWNWPSLGPGETAEFTFTVDIGDVAEVELANNTYEVCSAEGVCDSGKPLVQTIGAATFEATAEVDPIAKKPGGGNDPSATLTTTFVVRNLGPGNAVDATAYLELGRISVKTGGLISIPAIGTLTGKFDCGDNCVYYVWEGSLNVGEVITFTNSDPLSTIGGEEGTHYTATVVITDSLGGITTEPVTATAVGTITHQANLIPSKSAPTVIGPGQIMTYTLTVANSGFTTGDPISAGVSIGLVDVVPTNTTVVNISDGGGTENISGTTVISWSLPKMGTGEVVTRQFSVLVDSDLISGANILNSDYRAFWYEDAVGGVLSNTGKTFTTTVREVGLIDSFKTVSPSLIAPGSGGVLTYYVHLVNSSGVDLTGVTVEDVLPWQGSTYQQDAVASSGSIDAETIISADWSGNVAAFSEEVLTMSVKVDPDYEGPLTNTVTINHPSLASPVVRQAVAYVTDKPVLFISKTDSPDPVFLGNELRYTIQVDNRGQKAIGLTVNDQIPGNTSYVAGSASNNGQLSGNQVQWDLASLDLNESRTFEFRVKANSGKQVINDQYGVTSAEGATATGQPVDTTIVTPTPTPSPTPTATPKPGSGGSGTIYLPIILK